MASPSLLENLVDTLRAVIAQRDSSFAGLGLIVYQPGFIDQKAIINLRPNYQIPTELLVGSDKLLEYLLTITNKDHSLHDGYLFMNHQGVVTHVAQFVQPPIVTELPPHEELGTRYLSSLLISTLPQVDLVSNVSTNGRLMLFDNGVCHDLNPKLSTSNLLKTVLSEPNLA